MTETLEKGEIYFFYRPAAGEERVEDLAGVQRFFTVLKPAERSDFRLLIVGQKKLPQTEGGEQRYWGFVDRLAANAAELREALARDENPSSSPTAPARPAGEGVYAIVRHENHTDLVYRLELPEEPGEPQRAMNIAKEGSYVLTIKNPEAKAPAGVGLAPDEKAEFPDDLKSRFGDRRWTAAEPVDFLDHPGAEFLLIGATEELPEDVDVGLEPDHETPDSADILKDLQLDRENRLLKPLFEGAWQ